MIKLLILDVDGVLTDGKISYSSAGAEIKNFNVKDGLGIKMMQAANIYIAIISGRHSEVTTLRANELGIDIVYQGIRNKCEIFDKIINDLDIIPAETAFIGDDYNDIALLKKVGYSATVKDGAEIVKHHVDTVIPLNGGNGAVRFFIELILKRNGQWKNIISQYF